MLDFRHIETWIFDLDNTLYTAECEVFDQIDARMTAFIRNRLSLEDKAARMLQKDYYVKYGATLSGLMAEHDVRPESFLDYVHDVDLAALGEDRALADALKALPGKKFIHTNGSVRHAQNVSQALGVSHLFDCIFDIKAAGYAPKPNRRSYERFLQRHPADPTRAVMFEDIPKNLEAPHALGMTTVLVGAAQPGDAPHIHHFTDNLASFLQNALTAAAEAMRHHGGL